MYYRQFDILATRPEFWTIPKHLPGRVTMADFVEFIWPEKINPDDYSVIVEVLDTSSNDPYRLISKLRQKVELPHVQYGWDAKILVLPHNQTKPAFIGTLNRGSTYSIPKVSTNGMYQLKMMGMKRPPGL